MRYPQAFGILVMTGWLMGGAGAGATDVPAPVPQPGPGPTVPPKPSDPLPVPPMPPSTPLPRDNPSSWLHLMADTHGAPSETVSGRLEAMNLEQRTGRLTTDMGKTVSFSIPNPELFRHRSIGERLTLKLDSAQRAIGVLEQITPELLSPGGMDRSPSH